VEQLDAGEPHPPQQLQLIGYRPGGILPVDVGEHLPTVFIAPDRPEILPVARPHHLVHARVLVGHEIGDPDASPGSGQPVNPGEGRLPVRVIAQVVEDGRGQDHVEALQWQVRRAEVPLHGGDLARAHGRHSRSGLLQHGSAQVVEDAVKGAGTLQQLEGVVAGAAPDIQHAPDGRSGGCGGAADQLHGQGRVDRGGLASLQSGEALDVPVEARADLV